MPPNPFFPNPLEDFEPMKPDFESNEDDWTDEESCPVCNCKFDGHTTKQIVKCALNAVRGGVTD